MNKKCKFCNKEIFKAYLEDKIVFCNIEKRRITIEGDYADFIVPHSCDF